MASETFSIIADKLLSAVRATLPLVSKDKEAPHLTQVRFIVGRERLELSATDGHALAKVTAPLEESEARELVFCLQKSYLPTLVKALGRVNAELRANLEVRFSVAKHRITVQVGDTSIVLPNVAEQLAFPDIEKAIPIPSGQATSSVTTFSVGPALLARVMRAASCIAASVIWYSPASPEAPIRFDVVDGEGALSATYVVMPMNLGKYEQGDDGDEGDETDRQTSLLPDDVKVTASKDGKTTTITGSAEALKQRFEKATSKLKSSKPRKPKK